MYTCSLCDQFRHQLLLAKQSEYPNSASTSSTRSYAAVKAEQKSYLAAADKFTSIRRRITTLAKGRKVSYISFDYKDIRKGPSPFVIREMQHSDFYNVKDSLGEYSLKTPKPTMKIKLARMLKVDQEFPDVKIC